MTFTRRTTLKSHKYRHVQKLVVLPRTGHTSLDIGVKGTECRECTSRCLYVHNTRVFVRMEEGVLAEAGRHVLGGVPLAPRSFGSTRFHAPGMCIPLIKRSTRGLWWQSSNLKPYMLYRGYRCPPPRVNFT